LSSDEIEGVLFSAGTKTDLIEPIISGQFMVNAAYTILGTGYKQRTIIELGPFIGLKDRSYFIKDFSFK
jgi:hypothetical protein